MSHFYYLDLSLTFDEPCKLTPDKETFKSCVLHGIQSVFGEFGTCIPIDVLTYNQSKNRAILRCPTYFYSKLRASLTLTGEFEDVSCSFNVHTVASDLLQLASDSASFTHAYYKTD